MDDNLADYRRFCANRLKRLERCKKTKSFCNLDDEIPHPFANSDSDLMLRGSKISPSYGNNIAFSVRSENVPLSSIKSETIPFCSGKRMFYLASSTSPITDVSRFGSTEVFSMEVISSVSEANLVKSSLIADAWHQRSGKYTSVTPNFPHDNSNPHLPSPSCLFFTTASTNVASQSSTPISSVKKLESETGTTINRANDYNDSNRTVQRNFDLLREKMVRFEVFHDFKNLLNFSPSKNRNFE